MPIAKNVALGSGVVIHHPDLVNLHGCSIGEDTKVGAFVEIQKNASIGRRCKISSHTFVCEGVTIEDEVFIGHGVMEVMIAIRGPQQSPAYCRLRRTGRWYRRVSAVAPRSGAALSFFAA